MKASDLFVRALEAEGVEYVFGIPGEENLDLLESLRTSTIKLILTRHEQGAGFMAATYGRLTGKAGVCLATLGPGATNFVTAAAYAQLGAMPMMMITGQKPVKASKQGHFQIVDIVDMMKPLTKYTKQIVASDNIPARVREAFRRAEEERPGATHLELPEDIADEETDAIVIPKSYSRRPVADDKSIMHAVEAITNAKRPLLMVGAASNRKTTSKMLREFVEKLGIPFFTTQMGKGVVDETHPLLWLGNAALSSGDFTHRAIEKADLIINVGHDVIEKPPFFMQKGLRTVIHVNYFSAEVDTVYFPQIEVIGDIANSVWRIKQRLEKQSHWDFAYFDTVRKHLNDHLAQGKDDDRFPMYPQRLVADIRKVLGPQDILCLDNGMYKIWFARYYRCREPNTLLLDNALATMGAGLPSGMAAKMVHQDRKVVALAGDGGFMMNSQELETAVRLNLNITMIVVRDNAYGMIKWKQANMKFPNYGMDMGNPDFVKYAESYGARGHRPATAAEFLPMLQKTLEMPGVDLIEVPIDYSDNDRILNNEIKELSSRSEEESTMLKDRYPYYLGSEAVFANTDLEVTDKFTGKVATRVAMADAKAIDAGIAAAVASQEAMAAFPPYKRQAVLNHCVQRFTERFEEIAQALCIEAGKPIKDSRGEVSRLIDTFRVGAEESVRIGGEVMNLEISARAKGYRGMWKRVPIGLCSLIAPFNFPLNLAAHKIAPAIAAGCTWVMKPASRTPIGALIMGEALAETDLPKGAFSILPAHRDGADLFTEDDRLKLLSFTGSPAVGWELKAKAGRKKVVLELGGNAACLVDADQKDRLDHVVERLVFGAFYQSGQSCISVQRILVHADLYDAVREKLVAATKALKMGDPRNEDTFIGPMISEGEAKRLEGWVAKAKAAGAKVLCGGRREGAMLEATVLEDVPSDTEINCEEAFGPVVALSKYTDFEDALHRINASKFGLQAGLSTTDIRKAMRAWDMLEVGGVVINDVPSWRVDKMPYGGVKDSGLGREGVRYAIEDMTEIRLLVIRD